MRRKAVVSWSGGKDCMLALWHARAELDVVGLLTTVTRKFERVSMHGVRLALLRQQVQALGLPLTLAEIPGPCANDVYEATMKAALAELHADGVEAVVCGDLFLEDVRRYREERLFAPDVGVFPLWHRPTPELAREFLRLGFRAVVCCVDTQAVPAGLAGRMYDEAFLEDLPAGADPCGENGEFHTFVFDGPLFTAPVALRTGERVLRDGRFCYCELLPE
jgi:uncharacterized protein (TIGR00290 family)